MIIGYARVSTKDQSLEMQHKAIKEYAKSVDEDYILYSEKESGANKERPELENALKAVQPNNKFVVYKLDRLARSTKQLYEIADYLKEKDVEFISITDNIDTTTSMGQAMFGMLSVFAQFERDLIVERTRAGLKAMRNRGVIGGRPPISDRVKRQVKSLFDNGESATEIARQFEIGRSTVYKIINENKRD